MPPTRSTPETAWLGARLKAHWRFKLIAGAIIIIAFFIGYFLLLSFHIFPVREMPTTALDRLIAFQPGALPLYLSLYLYLPIAPWLLEDKRDLNACCLAFSTSMAPPWAKRLVARALVAASALGGRPAFN